MQEIVYLSKFNVTGRGTCYVLDLAANGLPDTYEGLHRILGRKVKVDGKPSTIIGFEEMGGTMRTKVAFLIKPIK